MRLTEAIAEGGGLNLTSDEEDIRIVRGNLKKPIVYRYDVDDLISGKTGDVELAPGDVVFITRHWSAILHRTIEIISPIISAGTGIATAFFFYQQYKLASDVGDRQTRIQACTALAEDLRPGCLGEIR
jgi:hypothetical protein